MGEGTEGFDIPKGSVQDDPPQRDYLSYQRQMPIEEQLRAFPVPPRHVLITAAGVIEQMRRDLAALRHIDKLYQDVCEALPMIAGPEDEAADVVKQLVTAFVALRQRHAEAVADSARLDALDAITGKYSGRVICRWSTTGRGWRLHESTQDGSVLNVREAIDTFLSTAKARMTNGS